jgi:hypothetical protein
MSDAEKLRDAIIEALDDNDAFSAGDDEVATVLQAIHAAGWRIVPVKLTKEMEQATDGAHTEREAWAAMLAAAPKVTP